MDAADLFTMLSGAPTGMAPLYEITAKQLGWAVDDALVAELK